MHILTISDKLHAAAPGMKEILMEADVCNPPTSDELWSDLQEAAASISERFDLPDINKRPAIAATRRVYKHLGKEPNRYRPSSEALCRRIVKGVGLYRVNTLVDVINLLSMVSGYSIGGFDADKIAGDDLAFGVGMEDEDFDAIGRGKLNIAGMPALRDALGAIGTPTSDCERTKLTNDTVKLLVSIHVYEEEMPVNDLLDLAKSLLTKYACARDIRISVVE